MKILLIAGGWSTEREVSLNGAHAMQQALVERGHSVTFFDLLSGFDCLLETAAAHDFALINLHGVGRLLISLRIYSGLTQRDLAARLGIHESQVSRDERNEYHGITVGRATRILEILGARVSSTVEAVDPPEEVEV